MCRDAWLVRWLGLFGLTVGLLGRIPPAVGEEFTPQAHQFDLTLKNVSGFVARTSQVHVRENTLAGSRFRLTPALGLRRMDMPRLELTYWIDELNALQVYFRYIDAAGSHRLRQPATFNGTTLTPGQRLDPRGTLWMDGAVYYERRVTPWLQHHFGRGASLTDIDVRVQLGLEFTYLDLRLNNGRARVTATSPKGESSEDFYLQELPMPTLGLELYGQLSPHWVVEATVKGNWINRWNSLRDEGGTVYTSQWSFETHWRLRYHHPAWLGALQPFLGISYYYYRQNEQSREDGNFLRLSTVGPEFGVTYSF